MSSDRVPAGRGPRAIAALLLVLAAPAAAVPPVLSIEDFALYENDRSATGPMARLDRAATRDVTFRAVAVPGSATLGPELPADASLSPVDTLTIPAGQTEVRVQVYLNDDKVPEPEESFVIRLEDIVDAGAGDVEATVTISDDDETPILYPSDDRHSVLEGREAMLPLLANDVVSDRSAYAYPEATLVFLQAPTKGTARVVAEGAPGALDDPILYAATPGEDGEDTLRYRFCATADVCADATATIVIRPTLPQREGFDGFSRDIAMGGLRPLPSPRFRTTDFVAARVAPIQLSPSAYRGPVWDAQADARHTDLWEIPASAETRRWHVIADLEGTSTSLRLFVGVDTDGDGEASPDELRCTAIRAPGSPNMYDTSLAEPCELALEQVPGQVLRYWTLVQNTEATFVIGGQVAVHEIPDSMGEREVVVTGPGRVPNGEDFLVRLVHTSHPEWPTPRYGYLDVESEPGRRIGRVPVRLGPWGHDVVPLASGRPFTARTGSGRSLMFDVPPGATRVTVRLESDAPTSFEVVQEVQPDPADPDVGFVEFYREVATGSSGTGTVATAEIEGLLQEGRYFITPVGESDEAVVTMTIDGATPPVPPGAYFNPSRPGHGLVLYPAGGDWAGVWYHYREDRTPTWYWLQGAKPGDDGIWRGTIHRAAWDGDSRILTPIGEAYVTPASGERASFRFTWRFDGVVGSEPMERLGGDGCPTLAGVPLDASTHWFDPTRAGTGYSVQLWPDYEFIAAFVYDHFGEPRFLSAERSSFGGARATLDLLQVEGFCALCPWQAPVYRDVGTLTREWLPDGRMRMEMNALFAAGVDGAWTVDEIAQTLGGPGTTQGCPLP